MTTNQAPSFQSNLKGIPYDALLRFESKFSLDFSQPCLALLGPCWIFNGSRCKNYGRVSIAAVSDAPIQTHCLAYELEIGPIPEGHHLHHLCENPPCGRPDHLEPKTPNAHIEAHPNNRANIERAITHCPQGHQYSTENTYTYKGRRDCRECNRLDTIRKTEERRAHRAANPLPEKTHCIKGHPLSGDNLYVYKTKTGIGRGCKVCRRGFVDKFQVDNPERVAIQNRESKERCRDAFNERRRLKRKQAVESSHGKV